MAYRKFTASRIFNGIQFEEQTVLVTTQTGRVIELVTDADAGDDVEVLEGILCPGFVNAHCHTELSHMSGNMPQQTGMVAFLMQVMFNRQADDAVKQAAIATAIDEMYAGGIVAVGDICNTSDSIAAKTTQPQVYFHNFIEASGFVPATAMVRFEQAVKTQEKFGHYFPVGQNSITPHAPYSVSARLMQMIGNQAQPLLSIHNQESQAEDDFIRHKNGEMLKLYEAIGIEPGFFEATEKSPLQYMLEQIPSEKRLLLVHDCFTGAADIEWLQKKKLTEKTAFCLCANANLYIGNPLPSIVLLQQSGINICLGTDSLASNHQLSILAEMQTLQHFFPFLDLQQLLRWATFNGAAALMIGGQFGSFKKGTKPGVLQISGICENDSLQNAAVTRII
jgi:cytosine/adenosine deaminase-related metal-dependent hydrolase